MWYLSVKAERLRILELAAREIGCLVDYPGWWPSDRGEVKHLLRKGFLEKKRQRISRRAARSMVHATDKGRKYLEANR